MIKSLPNLRSFLRLTEKELTSIISNVQYFYSFKRNPKKKYGGFQRDDFGNIKYRDLMLPKYILKSRQKYLAQLLNQVPSPEYMYGSVKNRNNIENACRHLGHQYFLTIDLKKFFPNINHHQVNSMFLKNGFSPTVASVLTKLTTYQYSLPQGSPSSPVIANLIFIETGNRLNELAKSCGVSFTVFLDDLTFSSNCCFKYLIPKIIYIIKQDGFYPAYEKIHYRKEYCEVTGLFVKGEKLELPYIMQSKAKLNSNLKAYQDLVNKYNLLYLTNAKRINKS